MNPTGVTSASFPNPPLVNMPFRRKPYIITSEDYDGNYYILGHVVGPSDVDIDCLIRSFRERYGVPGGEKRNTVYARRVAISRMRADGLRARAGDNYFLGNLLLEWLIRDHGFEEIKVDECCAGALG